jgi:flagellar L-ring protein precursor FlgH
MLPRITTLALSFATLLLISACDDRVRDLGRPPSMTSIEDGREAQAMSTLPMPREVSARRATDGASLWAGGRQSLLGDRRARQAGDILTVVIEIDDKAQVSASSQRGRSGSESMSIAAFLGFEDKAPLDALELAPGLSTNSSSASAGDGTTSRNEKITLRVAATVVGTLPNGVLQVQGSQEVRVNFELRELLVSGFVRPEDISRQNEIPYDKIASARISYGGRGHITNMQQPRIGQQVTDMIMPF